MQSQGQEGSYMEFRRMFLALSAVLLMAISTGAAQTPAPAGAEARDGQHDFDFDWGTWKTHSSRLMHPLTGSKEWADMDGMTVVKKIWDGRANIAEYKADGAAGHVELLSLRWYNAATHQWSLDFATPGGGTLGIPCVGEFKNARGDFYDYEEVNGKYVVVRFSIWRTGPETAQSEQAFSPDGGKTWEVNWINKYTRMSEHEDIDWSADMAAVNDADGHNFDFNVGTWRTQIQRTPDPFFAPNVSMEINGTVAVRKVWGGRALLEEIEADGPAGHWEALTLFLYNPRSHQWSQNFINRQMATLSTPLTGSFSDGKGELYSGDTFKDRAILVRGTWSGIEANSHRYGESYSDDGGQTWKTAFQAKLTRIKQ
jgi:hypothetical protein